MRFGRSATRSSAAFCSRIARPKTPAIYYTPGNYGAGQIRNFPGVRSLLARSLLNPGRKPMNGVIYLVGLIVVILAILSFFGLR